MVTRIADQLQWWTKYERPREREISVPRADSINDASTSSEERQLTLAAENQPLRVMYGTARVGAGIANCLTHGNDVVVQCIWGLSCDSIVSVKLNDEDLPSGSTLQNHVGDQVAADSILVAAFAARSITYEDILPGIAYSVVKIPAASFNGGLSFNAIIKGRQVYDPRGPSTAWSDNPSLILADFLTNSVFGANETVDYTSVGAAADWNDTDIGGEKHRILDGYTIDDITAVENVKDALRAYAGVSLIRRGATIYFVQDKTGSSVKTYSHTAGTVVSWSSWEKRDVGNSPTVVEMVYTDASQLPWRDRSAFAQLSGVGTSLPRRVSTVRLNGIHRYTQARREAIERLNHLTLSDLLGSVTVFDDGMALEAGDIVTVSLPFGVVSKPMRLTSAPEYQGDGMWTLSLVEYDPLVYSTLIETVPTYPDTGLGNPAAPPAPSVTVAEELFRSETGQYFSRARVTITPPSNFPWVAAYRVEILKGVTLIDSGLTTQTTYASPALEDLQTYTARVATVSTVGAVSSWGEDSFVAQGKYLPPSDVPSITGFEAGGDVYLSWAAARDIDIWRYELRYGPVSGGSWATAKLLDSVDAMRYVARGVFLPGVVRIYVKALDSVGNYSANAAHVDITVTLDPDRLKTEDTGWSVTPTISGMAAYQFPNNTNTYYVSESGSAMDSIFTANPLSSDARAADIMVTYQSNVANYYESEEKDFGVDLQGDWTASFPATNLDGTSTLTLSLATAAAPTSFTDYTSLPVRATARYAKVKRSITGEMTLTKGTEYVEVAAVTKKESNTGTSVITGATVNLDGKYFAYRRITVTPITSSAYFAVVDSITLHSTNQNSFKVFMFDTNGSEVAGVNFAWVFEGV